MKTRFLKLLTGKPPAEPGYWYVDYNQDWHHSHYMTPRSVIEANKDRIKGCFGPGCFGRGNVWSTSTPEWDRRWFEQHGMSMPQKVRERR